MLMVSMGKTMGNTSNDQKALCDRLIWSQNIDLCKLLGATEAGKFDTLQFVIIFTPTNTFKYVTKNQFRQTI